MGDGSMPSLIWLSPVGRLAMRTLPIACCIVTGLAGYLLHPGPATLELGIVALVAAVLWFVLALEPVFLAGVVLLGVDVAVATDRHPTDVRELVAVIAGAVLYLAHASVPLSALLKRNVAIEVRVLRRWLRRTIPVACTSLAGVVAVLVGEVTGDERELLAFGAAIAAAASLALLWPARPTTSGSDSSSQAAPRRSSN
jgi:hypothetical protein